jgi:hypothetical protein
MGVMDKVTDFLFSDYSKAPCVNEDDWNGSYYEEDMTVKMKEAVKDYIHIKKFLNDNSYVTVQCSLDKSDEQSSQPQSCINLHGMVMLLNKMSTKFALRDYHLEFRKMHLSTEDKLRRKKIKFNYKNAKKFARMVDEEIDMELHKVGYSMDNMMIKRVQHILMNAHSMD